MRAFIVILVLLILACVGILWIADVSLDDLLGEKRVKEAAQAKKAARSPGESGPDAAVTATGPLSSTGGKLLYDPILVQECTTGAVEEGDVPSQVDGNITDMLVDLGYPVRAGAPLAFLDRGKIRLIQFGAQMKAEDESPQEIAGAGIQETRYRMQDMDESRKARPGSVSEWEYRAMVFQNKRFLGELEKAKREQDQAKVELDRVYHELDLHRVKSAIDGEVVAVYKRRGESVKAQDPVCRVANFDRLRIEGLVDRQKQEMLRVGMRALVTPLQPAGLIGELRGHTGQVTGLAVTPDGHFLASASTDGDVVLWRWGSRQQLQRLDHNSEVHTLVCDAYRKTAPYQFLTGCSNARAFVWHVPVGKGTQITKTDLFDANEGHFSVVRCGAFHPNGKWVVTGGDDRRICVWNLADGKWLYRVESAADGEGVAHRGAVTALHFTPDGRLVSAGQDGSLRVWKLGDVKAQLEQEQAGRTGEVARLGVSRDGKRALFDHGDELRVLDLDNNLNTVGSIRNRGQEAFKNLAVFSTNGRLVLSSIPGRAQLWTVPATPEEAEFFRQGYERGFYHHSPLALGVLAGRLTPAAPFVVPTSFLNLEPKQGDALPGLWRLSASELRHVDSPAASEITCAAFTPDDGVMFTGSDVVIRFWRVPSVAEISTPLEATVTYVADEVVETGVKVRAELDNPRDADRRLKSGTKVNLTLYPETATKPEGRVSQK